MTASLPHADAETPIDGAAVLTCLSAVLEEGDEAERCLAVQALRHVRDSGRTDLLIASLRDPDPDVRCDAATVLAAIRDDRAVPVLLANLREDPVGDAKVLYVKALDAIGAREAADLLRILAVGRGAETGIAWDDEVGDWDDWLDVQIAAIEALGAVGDGAGTNMSIAAIRRALDDIDGQDLWAVACPALARLGAAGCASLADLAAEAGPLNRKRIAAALVHAAPDEAGDLLADLCADAEASVRVAAIETAAGHGANEPVQAALADRAPDVRRAALGLVGSLETRALLKLLNDVSPDVRIAACRALQRLQTVPTGLDLLAIAERSVRTARPDVMAALVDALAGAAPRNAVPFFEDLLAHKATDPLVRCAAVRGLARLGGPKRLSTLRKAATDKAQDVRLVAIAALGDLCKVDDDEGRAARLILSEAIGGALIPVPADWQPPEDTIVPFAPKKGAQAAGDEGDASVRLNRDGTEAAPQEDDDETPEESDETNDTPDNVVPLSTLDAILSHRPQPLQDEQAPELEPEDLAYLEMTAARPAKRRLDPEASAPAHLDIRRLAARIAGETGHPDSVPALALAIGDADRELADAALSALCRLGETGTALAAARSALMDQARHADPAIRSIALQALGYACENVEPVLLEGLDSADPAVRAAALSALARHVGYPADLAGLCRDPARIVRRAAVDVAASRPVSDALPLLLQLAEAEEGVHKQDVAARLRRFGNNGVKPVLAWTRDSDPRRRRIGLEMLAVVVA